MMKMTVGRKILGGFLFVIALTMLMSAYTYWRIGQINDEYQFSMRKNMDKVILAEELSTDIAEEAGAIRRYNLTGDAKALQNFQELQKSSNDKIQAMEQLYVVEKAKQLIKEIKENKLAYENFALKAVQAKQAGLGPEVLQYIQQGDAPYDKATDGTGTLVNMVKDFAKAEQETIAGQAKATQRLLLIVNILVVIVSIVTSLLVSRSISRVAQQLVKAANEIADGEITRAELQSTAEDEMGQMARAFNRMKGNLREILQHVTSSAQHVSASSQQLAATSNQSAEAAAQVTESITHIAMGAERQMNAVQETTAVVQQMSASVQQVAANANQVAAVSEQTADAARVGGEAIQNAIRQMQQIEQTVHISAELVGTLGERSNEIGQIVDTIAGIASQTNLLALNAAIEAARAGEQGRGFAVVAEEVRKLAEQSQEAAKQIAALIADIQGDTEKAVSAMDNGTREVKRGGEVVDAANIAFANIAALVGEVSGQVEEITAAMQQMAGGSRQIVTSVEEIDQFSKKAAELTQTVSAATEEQSASVEEIAASSQSLSQMAEGLQTVVSKFRVS